MSTSNRLYRVMLACGCVVVSRFGEQVVPEPDDILRCPISHGGKPQTVISVEAVDDNWQDEYIWST